MAEFRRTSPRVYSLLAPIYDQIMAHIAYDRWVRYILDIGKKYPFPSRRVLELGGGTGKLAQLFEGRGYSFFFSDACPGMAQLAGERIRNWAGGVFVQDARSLATRGPFGLVLFLYDGINYLRTSSELSDCMTAVHEVLLPGGYFLFDVTTEMNSIIHFTDYLHFGETSGGCYVRHSRYDSGTRTQHNHFNIFHKEQDGRYSREKESHAQTVFALEDIEKVVLQSEMELVGMWEGFGFRKANRQSERVHFLLRKNKG